MLDVLSENPTLAILGALVLLWILFMKFPSYSPFSSGNGNGNGGMTGNGSYASDMSMDEMGMGYSHLSDPTGVLPNGEEERMRVMQSQNDAGCHVNSGWGGADPGAFNEGDYSAEVKGIQGGGAACCGLEKGNTFGTPSVFPEADSMGNGPLTSADLLPKTQGDMFDTIQPTGEGGLDKNFLLSSHHIGVNTVGQSLKNANMQLRSEPPNPQNTVGPWNNSTISHDHNRRHFEIGYSCQ